MAQYIKGYGTFDPALPDWLAYFDGKLYNRNATANRASLTEPWSPPPGFTGGTGYTFTPESATPPQPPEPPQPPQPPQPPAPPPVPVPNGADPRLVSMLLTALRAVVAHDNEMLALARQRMTDDTARMQEGLRLATEAQRAFDDVLSDLLKKVNSQA